MSKWPENASPEIREYADEFFDRLRERLARGYEEYGDGSFDKPGTPEQILEEILDLSGWGFVLYVQFRRRLAALEEATRELEPAPLRCMHCEGTGVVRIEEQLFPCGPCLGVGWFKQGDPLGSRRAARAASESAAGPEATARATTRQSQSPTE